MDLGLVMEVDSDAVISGLEEKDLEDIHAATAWMSTWKRLAVGWGTCRGSRGVYFSLISSTREGKAASPPPYQLSLWAILSGGGGQAG
ncbi:hypothetical protein CgunFtcFv8_017164 [Champsocephalus gunnari]|uniref:Uncharacterized protein n=1 Tax=Champsocephalus gunnari TaxID=52237 RepID=A0AAN8DM73_CHAGU|nr:hypothetical protein CgunFtcFv8_017164 [Champsocephalus gunnari]